MTRDLPPRFAAGVSVNFAAYFAFLGIYLPFFPIWLDGRGLTSSEIAIVLALVPLARVPIALPAGAWADRRPERANVVVGSALLLALAITAHMWTASFWPVFAVHAVFAAAWVPHLPVVDAIALSGSQRDTRMDYGALRSWGSIAFLVATVLGGWLFSNGDADLTLGVLIALAWLTFATSLALPRLGRARAPSPRAVATLLADRPLVLILLGTGLVQASHSVLYGFGSIHWASKGFSATAIGVMWAIGVAVEIALFRALKGRTMRIGASGLVVVGATLGILRWTAMAFDPGLWATAALQTFHMGSFACLYLGLQLTLAKRVPEERSAGAQGLMTLVMSVAAGLATLAAGPLYGAYAAGAYWLAAAMCVVGLCLSWAGLYPQSAGVGGETRSPS